LQKKEFFKIKLNNIVLKNFFFSQKKKIFKTNKLSLLLKKNLEEKLNKIDLFLTGSDLNILK